MYILALKHVQLNLDANSYTEVRKLIDVSMESNFKYVIYAALLSNLILVMLTVKNPGSLLFITAAVAFVALILDTLIAVKGNIPINEAINSWSSGSYPTNWTEYRTKWLHFFKYRQIINISGFVILLIGAVFGSKY
ncbi:hypothetical protein GCM10027275_42120 [Rhabdobacter roseus]